MNASTNRTTTTPVATTFACAGALLSAATTMLRRLGFSEVGNDSLSMVITDLSRIESVLVGRANGAQHGAPAPVIAPSPAITMPEFTRPNADATYAAMTAPVALPIDPPTPDDDDEPVEQGAIECADDDGPAPVVCAKCKGKGTWRFGRPCPDCQVAPAEQPVATVAANKPIAAPALTTDDCDDVPVIGYDDLPPGYTIAVQQPIMRNGKPLHIVEFDDEQLYDDYSPTKALAFAQKHAIDNGRARRAPKPAPTPMSQKPAATAPALRQGNSSAPLDAPAPATKSSAKAAPSPAKPTGKATPAAPAPVVVAPPSIAVNADHVNRATEALDKGSLKALALACAIIGLPCRASDGAKAMREALATWLLANDDVEGDDEQGATAAIGSGAPAVVMPSQADPRKANNPMPAAPIVKPVAASKPAPKTVDTSATGGLPLNQWRMLLVLDDSNVAMTYKGIDEVCQAEFGTSYYSGMTAALRDGKPDSLSDRGLVSESLVDVEGRSKFAFTVTPAGKALVAKHS